MKVDGILLLILLYISLFLGHLTVNAGCFDWLLVCQELSQSIYGIPPSALNPQLVKSGQGDYGTPQTFLDHV